VDSTARAAWRWAIPAEARWAALRLLALFAASRALLLACAVVVERFVPVDPLGSGGAALRATERPILASLTAWDGVYYLSIARSGYHVGPVNGPYPDTAFFPLYPLLIRVAAPFAGGDVALAGVLVANLAFLGALGLVYALARRRVEPAAALLTAVLVTLQPGAVAFGTAYSDSLFLLLTVATFLAAERGQRGVAGACAGLAALTRLPGALLFVPLLIMFARQDRRPRASWLWALGGPLGLLAFCAYLGVVTGDPLASFNAQAVWDPGQVPDAVSSPPVIIVATVIYGAVALVELRLLYDLWRRRSDPPGVAWAVANIGLVIASRRGASLLRYLTPLVQLPQQLASGGYGPRVIRWVLAGSAIGFVILAVLQFSLLLAP
jgi:hypothetical protein